MSYFEHAHSPYPLEDAERIVPYDILMDMSITVTPELFTEGVYLTSMRVTPAFAFLAFETPSSGAVAHAFVEAPVPGRLYRMESQLAEGWVVFGPGVRTNFILDDGLLLETDPKVMIIEEDEATGFTLEVNGKSYPMPSTLTLVADGFTQNRVEAQRNLSTGLASVINISRNDAVIDETLLTEGLVEGGNPPIRRFGDAVPDDDGNIDITITSEVPLGNGEVLGIACGNTRVVGLLLKASGVLGCSPTSLLDQLRFSDCGEGTAYELPFDRVLEDFQSEDGPCGPEAPDCDLELGTNDPPPP
jgi:hypothetical protein